MKKDLVKILCCPTCKGNLDLKITKEDKNEIITGKFICKKCSVDYLIKEGIPDLLPR